MIENGFLSILVPFLLKSDENSDGAGQNTVSGAWVRQIPKNHKLKPIFLYFSHFPSDFDHFCGKLYVFFDSESIKTIKIRFRGLLILFGR